MKSPIMQLNRAWLQARAKKDPTSDYLLLASVDRQKKPHVRTVLIKTLDRNGIGFVTNRTGPKNEQFKVSSGVEGCIVWPGLHIQVRVAGKLRRLPKALVQKLWNLRPREAQLLYHLGLKQSSPIPSYSFLLQSVARLAQKWVRKKTIPLSPNYIGYFLQPTVVEFLHHHPSRLNKRELFKKGRKSWFKATLAP